MTTQDDSDPQRVAEQHESITLAFLVLLETLTSQERAVFLLREVFAYDYAEVAEILSLSVENCRQLFHRAKECIVEHRPRFQAAPAQHHQLVERFLSATQQGNVEALTQLLAQDVTLWSDGGGKVSAPRKPAHGRETVAKVLVWFVQRIAQTVDVGRGALHADIVQVNNEPAVLVWIYDRLDTVLVLSIADDQITVLRLIRNPEKLVYIQRRAQG